MNTVQMVVGAQGTCMMPATPKGVPRIPTGFIRIAGLSPSPPAIPGN